MIDKKIKDLYEEGLESICSFAANVKINDLKKLPFSKEAKSFIWKKFIIPFKSYIHINDLTWGYVSVKLKADDLFDPMETMIIAFMEEVMAPVLAKNGIETDTAFNEYFTYMVDCMEEENKVA